MKHVVHVYQKYIKISAKVNYAPPTWKRTQVHGLKESRLTIRGDEDQGLGSSKMFGQVPSYSPNRLVSQSAILYVSYVLVQGCKRTKQKRLSPLNYHRVILQRPRRLTIFEPRRDEIRCAFDPPKSVDKIIVVNQQRYFTDEKLRK